MGTVRGRIGDQVFYVKQGEQNIIKHQTEVSNPQTSRQMYQRAMFATAGIFFKRGRQQFFKFAFENKKKASSDFNAFMHENIKNAIVFDKTALLTDNYPVIAPFVVTKGSLYPVTAIADRPTGQVLNVNYLAMQADGADLTNLSTIGDVSKALIKTGYYENGDVLTFLNISTFLDSSDIAAYPVPVEGKTYLTPRWAIMQFILDVNSTQQMSAIGFHVNYYSIIAKHDYFEVDNDANYCMSAIIHSRPGTGSLKVSTQKLVGLTTPIGEVIELASDTEYQQQSVDSWIEPMFNPMSRAAVLKGSLTTQARSSAGGTVHSIQVPNQILKWLSVGETPTVFNSVVFNIELNGGYLICSEGTLTRDEAVYIKDHNGYDEYGDYMMHEYAWSSGSNAFVISAEEHLYIRVVTSGNNKLLSFEHENNLFQYVKEYVDANGTRYIFRTE